MPYKLEKVGGRYFVTDDKGKRYSKQPMSKRRALEQIKALYAAEQRKSYQFDYSTEKLNLINPPDYSWHPDTKAVYKAPLKDGLPASAFLVVEDPEKVTTWHLPVKNAEGKPDHRMMGAAWAALHGGYRGQKYAGPDRDKAIEKLKRLYEEEEMELPSTKAFNVLKEADGNYRWFLFSSSAFRDRDGEIVSTKALAEDVQRCDNLKEYGPLRWWHLGGWEAPDGEESWETWKAGPGIDLGTCDFNMLHDKILIESGTFKSKEIGEAIMDAQDELEVSIGFSHPEGEPDNQKIYNNIHRFERSLLPAGMASNLLTKLSVVKGESSMDTKGKLAALVAILRNKPDVAKQILSDAEMVQKAAEAAGLEFKEVEELLVAPESTETDETEEEDAEVSESGETAAESGSEALETNEEIDEIGDMSHSELKEFVLGVMKEVVGPAADKTTSKQADIDQALSDALKSLKGLGDRLTALEDSVKATEGKVSDLLDTRPVGIKQLMDLRPSGSDENVVNKETVVNGPHIDNDFMRFAKGGK